MKESSITDTNIKSLRIASAIGIIAGSWSLIFEIFYFRGFIMDIYFARLLFTIIALLIFVVSFRDINHVFVTILIHILLVSLIGSFIYTIYKIPRTILINSQILSLLIFTTALIFSWEVKNQIIVAIYYNILFAGSIVFSGSSVYLLPNIFAITIFICLISLLSIAASAINYNLRKMYQSKSDEINYIFNNVPIGICRTDLKGNILTNNKYFAEMLGLGDADKLLSINRILNDKELNKYLTNISSANSDNPEYSIQYSAVEDTVKYLRVNSKLQDVEHERKYIDFIIKDETNEVIAIKEKDNASLKLLEETKEKEKMANLALSEKNHRIELLAKINHEIRTPLNSIILFLDMVEEDILVTMEDVKKYSRTIKVSSQSLLNTINNFIDYAKIGTGVMVPEPELFNLSEELEGVVQILSPLAKSHSDLLIIKNANESRNVVFTDPAKIRQIVINLVANSVKFTHDGTIEVIFSNKPVNEDGYEITIKVKDTGYGISEEKVKNIFDPFVTSKSGDIMQHSSGLGLTICKEFVQMLNGKIEVESKVGKGTMFTVSIPYKYKYPENN